MFKAGDIVEITEESDATGMLDFKKGKGYRVANIAGGMVRLLNESGRDGWYHGGHFKLKEDTEVEKNECLFKKGQVVWDLRNGRGVVESVNAKDIYPVKVKFDLRDVDGYAVTDRYTADGRFATTQTIRSLYFSEPKIEAATEPLFEPVLKKEIKMGISIDAKLMYGLPYRSIIKNLREDSIELLNEEIYDGEWDTASPYYDSEMTSWFIGYTISDFGSSYLPHMILEMKDMDEKFQKRFGVRGYITACAAIT